MDKKFDRKVFINNINRIVIKIGTNVISEKGIPIEKTIKRIVEQIVKLTKTGKEVVIVTSGAIGCGAGILMQKGMTPKTMPLKQACASVGQPILMNHYSKYFKKHGMTVGQILLTDDILHRADAYKNACNTMLTLIGKNTIPIVNENDTIAIEEIKFGDNDKLAAVVSLIIGADICILLSDIDGFYINFHDKKNRKRLDIITKIDENIINQAGKKESSFSTGGMISKISAAKMLLKAGIDMAILNGKNENSISSFFNKEDTGSIFLSKKKTLSGIRRWLSHITKIEGKIKVDKGAYIALKDNCKSLLPSGIINVEGNFESGAVVNVFFGDVNFGRGISWYSSKDIEKIKGHNSCKINELLGYKDYDEVINRDNLLIITE